MKLKSKSFWVTFVALSVMLAQLYGLKIEAPIVNEVIDSMCAVMILFGVLSGKSSLNPSGGESPSDPDFSDTEGSGAGTDKSGTGADGSKSDGSDAESSDTGADGSDAESSDTGADGSSADNSGTGDESGK